jgi:hypothetical protein
VAAVKFAFDSPSILCLNPWLPSPQRPKAERILAEELRRRGWRADSPQQERLGQAGDCSATEAGDDALD